MTTTCVLIIGILLIERISAIYTRIHGFKKNSSCTKRDLCKLVSVEVLIFYLGDSKLCFRSKLNILKENYCILSSKFANIELSKTIFYDKNHLKLFKVAFHLFQFHLLILTPTGRNTITRITLVQIKIFMVGVHFRGLKKYMIMLRLKKEIKPRR